jgi:uncharacterized flavoprotein (TIGR03862 family)
MAAEVLSQEGLDVQVFDAMPSVGRKFLLAGKGGLNLTHAESAQAFAGRYGARRIQIEAMLGRFGSTQVRQWAQGLGVQTFVGSSGRVFPNDMKAAPLLRAWLHRLRSAGVRFHMRQRWDGWDTDGALRFVQDQGKSAVSADATVLALGGASWPRLGSDGSWVLQLQARGVAVAPLRPANCGFDAGTEARKGWSDKLRALAGQPFKSVALDFTDSVGARFHRKGEFVLTQTGIEGSLVYAVSALVRDEIERVGHATVHIDLLPDMSAEKVAQEVAHPRGSRSLSSHLKSRLGLEGLKLSVLYEVLSHEQVHDAALLAASIKHLPIRLVAPRPVAEAISSAGGVLFEVLNEHLMLQDCPGVFCAGEMLDWEAPTGGYLLTASMASGFVAAKGVVQYLKA